MTIHHGIVKAAAKSGIVLSQPEAEEPITAHHTASNRRIEVDPQDYESDNDAAKSAHVVLQNILDFEHEHEGWRINQVTEDDGGWEGLLNGEAKVAVSQGDHANPEEALDELRNLIENPETDEADEGDDEEPEVHSVVPDHFKKLYAQIGVNGQDCGDWLAAKMAELCTKSDGKRDRVDVDAVELLGSANGVDYPWTEGNRGWQGRYRMTMRNQLAKKIADAGTMNVPASLLGEGATAEIWAVPEDFIAKHKTKVKLGKKAKAEAEAAAAALAAEAEAPKAKKGRKGKGK